MKVKNIAFSGVMAAILMAGAANAAVKVASQGYVDSKAATAQAAAEATAASALSGAVSTLNTEIGKKANGQRNKEKEYYRAVYEF